MAEKTHAEWSASATSRNWNCAGALVLSQQVAHLDKESEAAAWGTACHEVSEMALRAGRDAEEYTGGFIKTKEHTIEVDDEMAECAQIYIGYVRGRAASQNAQLFIEQQFSLAKMAPPFEAGGIADAVIYFPAEKLLEVIDLKGGRGVKVDVAENKQLRTYALGAVLANPGLAVKRVRSTIVQPRIDHKDGRIRSEEFDLGELVEWVMELMERMEQAAEAKKAYAAITGDLSREAWGQKYLNPGDHCSNSFCPARGICPALEKKALEAAGVWFDDTGVPQLSNSPADLSPERLEQMLDAADMVEGFFSACRALAHTLAETGVEFPNYILVDKVGRRRWEDEEKALARFKLESEINVEDLYAPAKLKSPAQMEKTLGKQFKSLVADLTETPVTGKNFVRKDKTTRKAAKPAVNQHFNVIE